MHILFEDVIPSLHSNALSLCRVFFFPTKTKFKTVDVKAVSCLCLSEHEYVIKGTLEIAHVL